jgi:ankyrin repeat protein
MLISGKRWEFLMVSICAIIFSFSGFAVAEPLHEAAKEGDLAKVKSLIAEVSDVNVSDENGITPFHLAAFGGHKDATELLNLKGANVNAADKKEDSPLLWAEQAGQEEVVDLVIKHGARR